MPTSKENKQTSDNSGRTKKFTKKDLAAKVKNYFNYAAIYLEILSYMLLDKDLI